MSEWLALPLILAGFALAVIVPYWMNLLVERRAKRRGERVTWEWD